MTIRSIVTAVLLCGVSIAWQADENYLRWDRERAEAIGKSTYVRGKVGSSWSRRGLQTDRAINYKLAATWFTPEVIRAAARMQQFTARLTEEETRELVAESSKAASTVVMVELDPNEGSGVIPSNLQVFLRAGNDAHTVRGIEMPELRKNILFQGVQRRNYDYDRLWLSFPLTLPDGQPLFGSHQTAELIVRINNQEGRVRWTVPESIRVRAQEVAAAHQDQQ